MHFVSIPYPNLRARRVRFAAFTGLRSGELAALRIGDVTTMQGDLAPYVTVSKQTQHGELTRTKTASGVRKVPMLNLLRGELEAYLAAHPHRSNPGAPLWPGRMPGTKGDPLGLDYDRAFDIESLKRYYFKPALGELGLEEFKWHDLRHFYASVLIASKGYTDMEISRWMGHTSFAFTVDQYGHLHNETPDMGALDAFVASADSNVTPLRRRSAT